MNSKTLLLIFGLVLLLGGGGYAVYQMTRGLRNNNPGNIVYDPANNWLGQTGTDGHFAVFSSPVYGIRAMAKALLNYVNKDGVAPTVDSIIRRWSKTDQDVYVANVSAALGVDPREHLIYGIPAAPQVRELDQILAVTFYVHFPSVPNTLVVLRK